MKRANIDYAKNLLEMAMKYCSREGNHSTPIPELRVVRRDRTSEAVPGMYAALVCLVLQGEKKYGAGGKYTGTIRRIT